MSRQDIRKLWPSFDFCAKNLKKYLVASLGCLVHNTFKKNEFLDFVNEITSNEENIGYCLQNHDCLYLVVHISDD